MKVLSQQLIKQNNLKQVFALVRSNEGISRASIASLSHLSKATVSSLVEELIEADFIVDEGAGQTTRQGRKPNSLRVENEKNLIAVISWSAERFQMGFAALDGTVSHYQETVYRDEEDSVDQLLDAYHRLIGSLCEKREQTRVLALCVIVPGMIDPVRKRMYSSVLPVKTGEWVIRRFRAALPEIPLAFFNDTACFAYAEKAFDPQVENASIFVNLSGGVGAVMFSAGGMLRGGNGMTTQFGHFSVDRNGPLCRCGNCGCLEMKIGESVLEDRAREFMPMEKIQAFGPMTYESIGRAADAGDPDLRRMIDSMAADLAFALGNLITVYSVPRAVIGGHGRRLGRYFFERLRCHLSVCGFRQFVDDCEIRCSNAPEPAELIGAARYFMDNHFRFYENMDGALFLR